MPHDQHQEGSLPAPLLFSLWLLAGAIMFKSFNQLHSDYDLFWHLMMGEEILRKGAIQRFDSYSFTAFGQALFNHEWLSEVILAGWNRVFGEGGVIFFRWIMSGLIVGLGLNLIFFLSKTPLARIVVFLCFVLVLRAGISFRVHLFSMVFLLILLNAIYFSLKEEGLPRTAGVSLLFLIWANCHGAFVLGLLVWLIYVGEHLIKRGLLSGIKGVILPGLLPALATLVNPYGAGLWGYIIRELSNPISSAYITEWRHFSFAPRELAFFLVCGMCWALLFMSGRKKRLAETVLLVIATLMGFTSVRHTPLFVILCLPLMTTLVDGAMLRLYAFSKQGKPLSGPLMVIPAGLFCGLAALFVFMGIPHTWRIDVEEDSLPIQLVHFMETNGMKGNLFLPLHWGGYALFHLYPEVRVSIDGRWGMVYPHEVMADAMAFAYEGENGQWKTLLNKYRADFALVETGNRASSEMAADPEWAIVVSYPEGSLLVKKKWLGALPHPLKIPDRKEPSWP